MSFGICVRPELLTRWTKAAKATGAAAMRSDGKVKGSTRANTTAAVDSA